MIFTRKSTIRASGTPKEGPPKDELGLRTPKTTILDWVPFRTKLVNKFRSLQKNIRVFLTFGFEITLRSLTARFSNQVSDLWCNSHL